VSWGRTAVAGGTYTFVMVLALFLRYNHLAMLGEVLRRFGLVSADALAWQLWLDMFR